MKPYSLLVVSAFMIVIGCSRTAAYHSPSTIKPEECPLWESEKPMQIGFNEFEKQINAFEDSQYSLDILVIKIRPGRADNELKRFFMSSPKPSLMTARHGLQSTVSLKSSKVSSAALAFYKEGYFTVIAASPTGHTPSVYILVKRYGKTIYTLDSPDLELSCLGDSAMQKIQPGYNVARWMLQLR